jgi:hypothetical protein
MSPEFLFRALTLESLTTSSLRAEIPTGSDPRAAAECHAHVEFQLTPSAVEGSQPPQFALHVRLGCVGTPLRPGQRTQRLFEIEIKSTAIYRQSGPAVSLADFGAHHTAFARQLFPVLASRAQDLLDRLGLHAVRLPLDLPQEISQSPEVATGALN